MNKSNLLVYKARKGKIYGRVISKRKKDRIHIQDK